MKKFDIYGDIASRTDGDIYIGVVGPVRTGKSTFILKFMENGVLPSIQNKNAKKRIIDELPQSGSGKTVTTTQPKFCPSEGVKLTTVGKVAPKVRLIDCVGYMIDDAVVAEDVERLVKTPWSEEPMDFKKAAEIGTEKVIKEHSTVGVLVTTDGSVSGIERRSYVQQEERVVAELKEYKKPFVIILNTTTPGTEYVETLKDTLEEKYGETVIPMNVSEMKEGDVAKIMEELSYNFPLKELNICLPKWMQALPYENEIITEISSLLKKGASEISKMRDFSKLEQLMSGCKHIVSPKVNLDIAEGRATLSYDGADGVFYKVLSAEAGVTISSDFELVSMIKELNEAKVNYDKLKNAIDEVRTKGYGVVKPSMEEMTLAEPELIKDGDKYGVRLKATAPSLHIMEVLVDTEVNPIVGTEQQGQELVKNMLKDFEEDPSAIWQTNIFGKSLHSLVNDGLTAKLNQMPGEVQKKINKTVTRIVNEGKGGVICILL